MVECHPEVRRSGTLGITRIGVGFFIPRGSRGGLVPALTRSVMIIGLIGGFLFLLAGFFSLLPWTLSGSIAGVLLGSWFGGEIKKRLDKGGSEMGSRLGSLGSGTS